MPDTVFYAWQSDLPANTNRRFIRGAIDDALQAINQELGVDEALRADQDTQGVPGDVNVAEVIFEKIDRCRIFVADITTTTPPEAPRPAPNPNVLVEYGRASVRPGSAAVVQVFNEAFGDWKSQRPFDLRHRRKPVLYRLDPAASAKVRESARKALAAELGRVFRDILTAGQPTAPLPNVSEFVSLRQLYQKTPVGSRETARIIGFWCGLIPAGETLGLTAPWDRPELPLRAVSHEVRLGHTALSFETMDAMQINRRDRRAFEGNKGDTSFDPMQGGAQFLHRYRYPSRPGGSEFVEDVAAVYLMEDGCIALAVRTDNLTPVPNLNVRWVIADLINALAIMQRVRVAAGRLFAPYALVVELRYDEQGPESMKPVSQGEWRLCPISDEQGHTGAMMRSEAMTFGPLLVSGPDQFPEIVRDLYTRIVTSAGKRPEPDLDFSAVEFEQAR